jgi:beta-N-acetylhexosaminidase
MNPCQCLVIGVPSTELSKEFAQMLKKLQPGGYILFSRNIENPFQLRKLMDDLREVSDQEPFFMIDQEGGRVARLREMGAEPPSAKELVELGAAEDIVKHGQLTGKLLNLFGFNMNLCPVLDVSVDGDEDNSLKNRCFGENPTDVIAKASLFNEAMRSEGILSCAKHFPGYSCAAVDPHHNLPVIEKTRAEIEDFEWVAFKHFVDKVDSFMMGHALYPKIDPVKRPSSLSPIFINEILRGEWGFDKLVMTDDLDMGAILNYYSFTDSIVESVKAGNDLLLICHRFEKALEAQEALKNVETKVVDQYLERISKARKSFPEVPEFKIEKYKELDRETLALRTKVVGAERAQQKSPENAKRSPVEEY